jgi:hypothetical protein
MAILLPDKVSKGMQSVQILIKKFQTFFSNFDFDILAQCYKTFYRSNLPPFHGHIIILCYKATLPELLLWNGSKLPRYLFNQCCKA